MNGRCFWVGELKNSAKGAVIPGRHLLRRGFPLAALRCGFATTAFPQQLDVAEVRRADQQAACHANRRRNDRSSNMVVQDEQRHPDREQNQTLGPMMASPPRTREIRDPQHKRRYDETLLDRFGKQVDEA